MKRTLHDLSDKTALVPLARVIADLDRVASIRNIPFFLIGAAARDVMLEHLHGLPAQRATKDVDFAVMVNDWQSFQDLRAALLAGENFTARSKSANHKLYHSTGAPLDIVPFGSIERADRTIAWPPDEHTIFDCFGAREAYGQCEGVLLPGTVIVAVASIPSLVLLKIAAWQDRKDSHPGKDAGDLMLYLEHYLACGNSDRAFDHHLDMFEAEEFDYVATGARLLGYDLASFLDADALARILTILIPQTEANGTLLLASQSGKPLAYAIKLLAALCAGLGTDHA